MPTAKARRTQSLNFKIKKPVVILSLGGGNRAIPLIAKGIPLRELFLLVGRYFRNTGDEFVQGKAGGFCKRY